MLVHLHNRRPLLTHIKPAFSELTAQRQFDRLIKIDQYTCISKVSESRVNKIQYKTVRDK